ncbi:MAG: LysM peptidoglycan-binding domain-containing protein [Candidatus Promineifilaceae bacterium]|nr:LysM peptidoglycan-binding domain-containing protein [Candidatus Promineifilaceae bacterium]
MPARSRFLQYLTFFIVLALLATACVRPLSRDEGDADGADADIDVAATVESGGEEEQTSEEEAPAEETADQPAPAGDAPAEDEASVEEADQTAVSDEESMEEPAAEADEDTSTESEEPADAEAEDEAAEEMDPEVEATDESEEAEDAAEEEAAEETAEAAKADTEEAAETDAAAESEDADASAETTTTEPEVHIVQPGENLYRIGLQYNISWVRLAEYNGLTNANYIQAGEELRIPPAATPPSDPEEEPPATTNYVVQPGDNLYRIGLKFDISWVEIAEANGIVNPNQIYAGQELKIPTSAPGPSPEFTHDVQPGESLYRISLRYGVHWRAVAEANDLQSPYVIYPGQTLVIPGG